MNEAERVTAAFYELLAQDPETAPTAGKLLKQMGKNPGTMNGRMNAVRKRLLKLHSFASNDRGWYEKTRQWCNGCGNPPEMIGRFWCKEQACLPRH